MQYSEPAQTVKELVIAAGRTAARPVSWRQGSRPGKGISGLKQALGLAHFEGCTWGGWHHHVTLVSAAHAFCTLQRLARDPKDAAQV
jgi:SRSO17 transposase